MKIKNLKKKATRQPVTAAVATAKAKGQKAKSTSAPAKGKAFSKENTDLIPMSMVSARVPQRAIVTAHRNKPLAAVPTKRGFLLATGPRGAYIAEVLTEDGNFYARKRKNSKDMLFGQLDLLPKSKGVKITILNKADLLKLAAKTGKVVTFERVAPKEDVTFALLSSMSHNIMAGVTREGGKLRVRTLHHANKTQAPQSEQYRNPRDVRAGAKFVASLAS